MKPLKRCMKTDSANVILIDVDDDDDDDVIVVDSPLSSHQKRGGSSDQNGNQRVSPQSVISIEDDDNESHTSHLSVHDEDGFADVESDASATSSQRPGPSYGVMGHARSDRNEKRTYSRDGSSRNCYRFGDESYEFEPVEVDSDCEVIEDSSGMLREQWEKAAFQKKFSGKNPSADKVLDEEIHLHQYHDTLFPEFDWMNLGGLSSSNKPNSAYTRDFFQSANSHENVFSASFVGDRCRLNDQCSGNTLEAESRAECSYSAKPRPEVDINQAGCSKNQKDGYYETRNHDELFRTAEFGCACIFSSYCECKRTENLDAENVCMEEKVQNAMSCEEKCNNSVPNFDCKNVDVYSSVGADCEVDCSEKCPQVKDGELGKLSRSETAVRRDSYPESKGPATETDADCVPEDDNNDTPAAEGLVQSFEADIINVKEKLKETEEYKRTMELELALRQQQIKLQAEEAQRLRKRKRAEKRLLNLESRQKQRVEEVRALQKQDGANLNLKEQLRSEVMKELKALEFRCFDMASLLRNLGVQVEGGLHPSPQQVHAAYKRAVLKFHPDRTSGSNLKQQVEAEEKFKLISRMKEKYKFR